MATALLIVDCQSFFKSMVDSALPNILQLAAHFRARSLPIVVTQHGHSAEELRPPFRNQLVRKWGPDGSIAAGTREWELLPEIAELVEEAGCPVVAKNTYDAFLGTDYPLEEKAGWKKPPASGLEGLLREKGVERVVIMGVMTDCCCDTTGRSAFHRGFETWLVRDATGSASKTQHQAGLKAFGFGFGDVVDSSEVMQAVS